MSEGYRAPCIWSVHHSPSPYGSYIAVNQYGGFAGRHESIQDAMDWIDAEIAAYPGDARAEVA